DPALEAEEQVLPDCLDGEQLPTVDLVGDAGSCAPRMRALRLDPLADEHLEPAGRPVQGIALGHPTRVSARRLPPRACARLADACGQPPPAPWRPPRGARSSRSTGGFSAAITQTSRCSGSSSRAGRAGARRASPFTPSTARRSGSPTTSFDAVRRCPAGRL